MNKINFINGQAPALNANNLNLMQTNTENAIEDAIDEATATASADATSKVNSMASTLRSEIATAQSNAVGTSNTYTDNKVKNGRLLIQQNGSDVTSFYANSEYNAIANITVPTNNNQLTNGAGYINANDGWWIVSQKIQYGTSLPSSADNGTVFLLYS